MKDPLTYLLPLLTYTQLASIQHVGLYVRNMVFGRLKELVSNSVESETLAYLLGITNWGTCRIGDNSLVVNE